LSGGKASARVARGAIFIFTQGAATNLLSLVYLAFAANILTPEELGLLISLGLITTLVVALGTLGIPYGVIRFVAELIGRRREQMAQRLWRRTVVIGAVLSGSLSLTIFWGSPFLALFFIGDPVFMFLIRLIAFDTFALLFTSFFTGPLHARQQFGIIAGFNVAVAMLRTALPILLLLEGFGVLGVVITWIASDFTGLLLYALMALRWGGIGTTRSPMRDLMKYSLSVYGSNTATFFSTYLERYIILLGLRDMASMAFYGVAIVAANVVAMAASSISQALLPALSTLYGSTNTKNMKDASRRASRYVMLVCIPTSVGLALIADVIFTLINPVYLHAVAPTIVLCIATTITSLGIVANSILLSIGKARKVLESNLLGITGNGVVSWLLLPIFGVLGAAFGRAIHILLATTYSSLILKRDDLLEVDKSDTARILLSTGGMALAVIITRIMLPSPQLLSLFILVGALTFVMSVRFTKIMEREDYVLIEELLPSRLKGFTWWIERILGSKKE